MRTEQEKGNLHKLFSSSEACGTLKAATQLSHIPNLLGLTKAVLSFVTADGFCDWLKKHSSGIRCGVELVDKKHNKKVVFVETSDKRYGGDLTAWRHAVLNSDRPAVSDFRARHHLVNKPPRRRQSVDAHFAHAERASNDFFEKAPDLHTVPMAAPAAAS